MHRSKHRVSKRNLYGTTITKKKLTAITKSASADNIRSIAEIANNTIKGNLNLSDKHKNKIKKHAETIRNLAKKSVSLKKKKEILENQKGGFLPLLLTPFLTAAGHIVGKVLANALGM